MRTNLLILHTESSIGWGGQELRICLESIFQARQDCRIALVCDHRSQFETRGTFAGSLIPITFAKSFRSLFELKRAIQSIEPHILISHSSIDSWLAALVRSFWFRDLPLIRVRHVSAQVSANFWTRWLYRSATVVVTTSEHIRCMLVDCLRLNPDSVISIPTGVDESLFRSNAALERQAEKICANFPRKDHLMNVVMVSTLRSWKGHKYAIEALANLPDIRLLVVGDGPQELSLKRLVEKSGVSDRVEFFGFQSDVRPYLLASDIFLQPSYANEGVSQSLLQAAAMGLPVVASNIGGLNEVIVHYQTGMLVEPKSFESIKNALQELRDSPDLRDRLAKAGQAYVLEHCTAQKMSDRMAEVIRSAVKHAAER